MPVRCTASGEALSSPVNENFLSRSGGTEETSIRSQSSTPRKLSAVASTLPSKRGLPSAAVRNPKTETWEPPGSRAVAWLNVTSPSTSSALSRT